MVLAYCTTYYHLFNIIQLKLTLLKSQDIDVVVSADADFKPYENRLQQSKLFRRVILSEIKNVIWTREFNELPGAEQENWFVKHVQVGHGLPLDEDYTDLYIGLDDAYNKFLYYCLVTRGMRISIHLFDEGTASYVLPFMARLDTDHIPHSQFNSQEFGRNINELLLYEPSLRTEALPFPVSRIPMVNRNSPAVCDCFNAIFPYRYFPSQRYIYFEGGCFQDFVPTMDIEVLEQLAEIVGKENIVVKLHPRTTRDRFTRRGYHVMPQENVPWEIYVLNEDMGGHVYLSNASTASLTTHTVFGINTPAVNLFRLDLLEHTLYTRQKSFSTTYKSQEKLFNQDKPCFFTPRSLHELRSILQYLERR